MSCEIKLTMKDPNTLGPSKLNSQFLELFNDKKENSEMSTRYHEMIDAIGEFMGVTGFVERPKELPETATDAEKEAYSIQKKLHNDYEKSMKIYEKRNKSHAFDLNTGEPVLFNDDLGGYYVINSKGDRLYVKDSILSETARIQLIRAISFEMISTDTNLRSHDYVKNFFDEKTKNLKITIEDLTDKFKAAEDKKAKIIIGTERLSYKKQLKLIESFQEDLHFMRSLVKGINKEIMGAKLTHNEELIKEGLTEETPDVSLGFDAYLLASDEVKDTSTIDPEIFRLLATVTDFEYTADGNIRDITEPTFGMRTAKSTNEVKNRVLDLVNNILEEKSDVMDNPKNDGFDMMVMALKQHVAEFDDQLIARFLDNMEDLLESKKDPNDILAFKIKFFKSFNKGSNVYILTELQKGDVLSIKAVDPALIQNKQSQVAQEFVSQLVSTDAINDKSKLTKVSKLLRNDSFTKEDIRQIFDSLDLNISNNTIELIQKLQSNLSSLGYRGDDTSFKSLMTKLLNEKGAKYIYDRKGETEVGGKKQIGLKVNMREAVTMLRNPETKPAVAKQLKLMMGSIPLNTPIAVLANIEALNRTTLADSTFNIAGKSRYKYSNMNGINKMIKKWQSGDLSSLLAMKDKGFPYVDYLLGKGFEDEPTHGEDIRKRIAKIRLVTNAQLRDTGAGGGAVEHKEIGEGDLMFDQMFKLMNFNHDDFKQADELNDESREYWAAMEKTFLAYTYNADKGGSLSIQGLDQVVKDMISKPHETIKDLFLGEIRTVRTHGQLINKVFEMINNKALVDKTVVIDYINTKLTQDYHFKKKVSYTEPDATSKGGSFNVTERYDTSTGYTTIKKEFVDADGNRNPEKDSSIDVLGITRQQAMAGVWNKFGFFNSFLPGNEKLFDLLFVDSKDHVPEISGSFAEIINDTTLTGESILDVVIKGFDALVDENYNYISTMRGNNLNNTVTQIASSNTEVGIKNFVYASIFNNLQMFQMFAGDLGFYKQRGDTLSMEDALKRGPSPTTDGLQFMITKHIIDEKGVLNNNTIKSYKTARGTSVEYNAAKKAIIAVADNLEFNNSHYDEAIKKGVMASLKRLGLTKALENYGHEIADAGAYMTLNHYMNVRNMIYGLTAEDIERFNNLQRADYKPTEEDYEWLHLAGNTLQPAKLVGQQKRTISVPVNDNDANSELLTYEQPVFLKYAPMVLIPSIVEGTEAEVLLNQMKEQGVDQVVFKSGSKASNSATTTVHLETDGKFDKLNPELKLNPFEFDYSNLKWQVELPAHFDSENTIGNQHVKNLIANLDLESTDKTYHYKGRLITAKELYDRYTDTIKDILKSQSNRFLDKHGIVMDSNGNIDFNNSRVREMMLSQLDINEDYALINVLKNEEIPLETIPGVAQRLFPILAGYIHKKVGKIRTNTGSVIQVANIGFDRLKPEVKNQVLFLTNDTKLKPPIPISALDLKSAELKYLQDISDEDLVALKRYRKLAIKDSLVEDELSEFNALQEQFKNMSIYYYDVVDNKGRKQTMASTLRTKVIDGESVNGVMKINAGKVMMPFASIQKKLNMSWEQFRVAFEQSKEAWESGNPGDALIDEKLFKNIISYRIPNQSISSNDKLEIVGILPPYAGDQAVVYHEITKKAGSDFDVDKLYLMLPSFNVKNNGDLIHHLYHNHILKTSLGVDLIDVAVDKLLFQLNELKPDNDISRERLYKVLNDQSKLAKKEIIKSDKDTELEEMILEVLQNPTEGQTNNVLETYLDDKTLKGQRVLYSLSGMKGSQNDLIELMGSILTSESTYDDLMSPLDSDLVRDSMYEILYERYLEEIGGELDHNVETIISGGQTGVDTIGLIVAKKLGLKTGGTAPRGFLREENEDNEDIRDYGLEEISEEDQNSYSSRTGKKDPFTARTERNVINSDATVYFNTTGDEKGMIATRRSATENGKPFIVNPTADQLKKFLKENKVKTLNVAGNRGSKLNSKKSEEINNILEKALVVEKGVTEKLDFKTFKERQVSPMSNISPMMMVKTRVDMLKAKKLVATMANHMSDIAMSQIQKVSYNLDIGLGNLDLSKTFMDPYDGYFSNGDYNKYGIKLTNVVSYFMNAAVDAAKDAYIIDGNFNSYTAGAAMILIRSGISPKEVFRLLLHPLVKDISDFKQTQTELTPDVELSKYTYNGVEIPLGNNDMENYTLKYLLYKDQNNLKNLTIKDILAKLESENDNTLIVGFWNSIVEAGKELNLDISVSKPDSSGAGKNIAEFTTMMNNLDKAMVSNIRSNIGSNSSVLGKLYKDGLPPDTVLNKRFIHPDDQTEIDKFTFLGMMQNNSLYLVNSLAEKIFIEATPGYRAMLDYQMLILNNPKGLNDATFKDLSSTLYPLVMSQTNQRLHNIKSEEIPMILEDTLSNIRKLQSDKEFRNMDVIRNFTINPISNTVEFAPGKTFMTADIAKMREEFAQLYLHESPIVNGMMTDLISYAFLTTGFKPQLGSFNHILPRMYFTESGFDRSIKGVLNMLTDEKNNNRWLEIAERGLILYAMNNPADYKVSRQVSSLKNKMILQSLKPITDVNFINTYTKNGMMAPFLFTRDYDKAAEKSKTTLFMLSDLNEDGNFIYKKIKLASEVDNTLSENQKILDLDMMTKGLYYTDGKANRVEYPFMNFINSYQQLETTKASLTYKPTLSKLLDTVNTDNKKVREVEGKVLSLMQSKLSSNFSTDMAKKFLDYVAKGTSGSKEKAFTIIENMSDEELEQTISTAIKCHQINK